MQLNIVNQSQKELSVVTTTVISLNEFLTLHSQSEMNGIPIIKDY